MNLEAWLDRIQQGHPATIELGLDRCGEVYRRLGSPRPAKRVFTVAGTNGKGSTVAYLAALCGASQQRHGTYTSPHIFRFNERICIMGQPVEDDVLIGAFEQVEMARHDVSLTYFEFTTLAALLILTKAELDCAILEVGLGGRLDAVNLVDADCAVITPIGLDHQDYLGPDLDSIAKEKAGILRRTIPVVCTEVCPPEPVVSAAARLGAPLYRRDTEYTLGPAPDNPGELLFELAENVLTMQPPSMPGAYQLDNLAAALCAFSLLNPGCFGPGHDLANTVKETRVPGRLQQVSAEPEIFLDVGHNTLAAEAVASHLTRRQLEDGIGTVCVLAMLADKKAEEVAWALRGVCSRWLCAGLAGERGQTGRALARRVGEALPDSDITAIETVEDAIRSAVTISGGSGRILVFGSFMTVAAAADWLREHMRRGP